eukprot:g31591.t1
MYETLDKGRKNIANVAVILMATFLCSCTKLHVDPQYTNTKHPYLLKSYLSPVLRRTGLALLPWDAPSCETVPAYLSFLEKFAKKNTFDHQSIRKWSEYSVLETLRGKERVGPIAWFPEQTVKVIWQNALSPELCNKHQDITWLVLRSFTNARSNKELTLTECCRLAHSKIQDYMLRDILKLGQLLPKRSGERALSEVFLLKANGGLLSANMDKRAELSLCLLVFDCPHAGEKTLSIYPIHDPHDFRNLYKIT